jgi:putative transposase
MRTNTFYHIYNHANGKENLFTCEENYRFFLQKFTMYIEPIAETYAYCLMPNHFHFLIRIKDEYELQKKFPTDLTGFKNLSGLLSKQFSNLFNSYAKAYNLMYSRKGSLFSRPFKRKIVETDAYFGKLIHYIHANPLHHGFTSHINDWNFSSYQALISSGKTHLKRKEVLDWFNGKQAFINYHLQPLEIHIEFE